MNYRKGTLDDIKDICVMIQEAIKNMESMEIYQWDDLYPTDEDFSNYLIEQNEKELMIIGLQTNFCIDATIKSAFEKGYRVIVPSDTNSTFDNDYMDREATYKYYNEMMWPGRFAECVSIEKAVELLKREQQ